MNIRHQVLILGMKLVIEDFDDISDRDDAHELRTVQDGHLGDVSLAHLAHDVIDIIVEEAGHGSTGHDIGDEQPAEAFATVMDDAQRVAFAKDPDQSSRVVENGKRTNIVLDELGNGLTHGRTTIDRDQAATFGLQDISYAA